MKILFIQPTGDKRGHYGIYTIHVCQELAKLGAEITLFTNKIYPDKFIDQKPLFNIVEFKNGKCGFEKFDRIKKRFPIIYTIGYLKNSFIAISEAIKYLKKNKFDIVFVMDTEYSVLSLLLNLFGKNIPPLVLMVQAANFSFSKFAGSTILKIYKTIQRRILKSAILQRIKAFLVLGEFHKEELRKQLGLEKDFPIKVVYDGADPPKKNFSKEIARRKLGIKETTPLFLFFGMIRKDKGLEYLLNAIRLIKKENFKLIIAGSPFDYKEDEIKNMIKKLDIEGKIILRLGYVKDKNIPLYFFSSDAIIFPYRKVYTGGTGPLLKEAAIYKTPVIASDVSEMGRLVKRYKMGLVAEPENAKDLAIKMKEFLSMAKKEKEMMASNAREAANTWQKMGKEYLAFFKEIINEKN
jgi:glycosyltransferase involved in cell wall biosynthesis